MSRIFLVCPKTIHELKRGMLHPTMENFQHLYQSWISRLKWSHRRRKIDMHRARRRTSKRKAKGSREALPTFFKHPVGTLKNTPFGNTKGKKNIRGLCRRIVNGTGKILTATLHINGLSKFRQWPGTVKLSTGIHLTHQTM